MIKLQGPKFSFAYIDLDLWKTTVLFEVSRNKHTHLSFAYYQSLYANFKHYLFLLFKQ